MRRIRAARQTVEVRNVYRRNLFGNVFAVGDQVWVIDPEYVAMEAVQRGVDRNVNVVDAERDARFVHYGRADGRNQRYGGGLIRPSEILSSKSRPPIEWLIFEVGSVRPPCRDLIPGGGQYVYIEVSLR